MKARALVLAWALLAVARTSEAQQSAITEFTAGGVRVIFKPVPANEVIAVRLYLQGGSANLTPQRAGIEQFVGELARHGTEKYSQDEFAALSARTGTEIGAQAGHDFTLFTLRAVRDYWSDAWDLFTQAALHPTFPDDQLALVRNQLLNGLRQRPDDPDAQLGHLADSVFYAGHAYALDAEGTEAAIGALTRDDLLQWHRERFTKENLLLVVVGNVERADLEARVAAAFFNLPARGGAARRPGAYTARPADVMVVPRPLPTNYVQGMFAAPAPSDADYAAVRVGISILSDRLFEEVRTKRNLSYAVYAGLNASRVNAGFLYVTAVEPDTTLKVMRHEVERLAAEPISPARLAENVNEFVTSYLMGQEANMSQAAILGVFELVGGGWRRAESFTDRVRAVTSADVQRVASRYLRNMRFVVIGDSSKVDRSLFTSF
jgi:zinc protease